MERRIGPVLAVFVALAGAALLIFATLIYVLYGWCAVHDRDAGRAAT